MTNAQAYLRRIATIVVGVLCVAVALAAFFDQGRYAEEFRRNGLLGYLSLPSLLVFQLGFLAGSIILLRVAQRMGHGPVFRMALPGFCVAAAVYAASILLMYSAASQSEFGITNMGIAVLFFLLPSATILLLGVPAFLLYAARKSSAEPAA